VTICGRVPGVSVAIHEPVPDPLLGVLRRAVLDHASTETRRQYAPALHVGVPGGTAAAFEIVPDDPDDQALRVDVVEAMVRRVGRLPGTPLVWLTRPGVLQPEDTDLAWLAATRTAAAELGLAPHYVVVNRRAWIDPITGVGRVWQRPPRSRVAPAPDTVRGA
jgi:hypothetical protein